MKGDEKVGKTKNVDSSKPTARRSRPATNPESRQNQLISLAVDLAEQQLRDGTASSQVIAHFLKESTAKSQYEIEKLKQENELLKARTESLRSAQRSEEKYEEVLAAFRKYSGNGGGDEDEY